MCVRVYIEINDRMCMSICVYTVFLKKIHSNPMTKHVPSVMEVQQAGLPIGFSSMFLRCRLSVV
jgi:hypothetical protein